MIAKLIRWSIANRFLVVLATLALAAWGIWAASRTPLDAIPDLSDVQVIIRTTYPGQAPQIVENQITYPLTTTMLSVPGAKTVRGYSFFGDSIVYILFEDGTDPYWARSRVLEYLNQVQSRLPPQAKTSLGPDATGVGWVYEYALVDRSGRTDLSQLRALQDWFLKYELKAVTNVSEVASVGGMVKQYQIVIDPVRLRAFNIPHAKVIEAVQRARRMRQRPGCDDDGRDAEGDAQHSATGNPSLFPGESVDSQKPQRAGIGDEKFAVFTHNNSERLHQFVAGANNRRASCEGISAQNRGLGVGENYFVARSKGWSQVESRCR